MIGFILGPLSVLLSVQVYCLLTWSLGRVAPTSTTTTTVKRTEMIINIMQVIIAAMMATNYVIDW